MALSLVSTGALVEVGPGVNTIEVTPPASIVDDNLLVMVVIYDDNQTISDGEGDWTKVGQITNLAKGDSACALFIKKAASETGNYTVNVGGTTGWITGICFQLAGQDQTTPQDQTAIFSSDSDNHLQGTINPTGITTQTDGAWVFTIAAGLQGDGTALTQPTGYTLHTDSLDPLELGIAYKEVATAGLETPDEWSGLGTGFDGGDITFAIRPESIPGPGSSSDSGAFNFQIAEVANDLFLQMSDIGNIVATETAVASPDFLLPTGDGDTDDWDSTETGTVFPDILFKSSSDSGSIGSTESSSVSSFGTTQKSASDTVTDFDSTESSSLSQFDPTAQKAGTDDLDFSSNLRTNLLLWSRAIGNVAWTQGAETTVVENQVNAYNTEYEQGTTADLVFAIGTGVINCTVEQAVTVEVDKVYTMFALVNNQSLNQQHVWIGLKNNGADDKKAWFEWEFLGGGIPRNRYNPATKGASVIDSGSIQLGLIPGSIQEYNLLWATFTADAADTTGDFKIGVSAADNVETYDLAVNPSTPAFVLDGLQLEAGAFTPELADRIVSQATQGIFDEDSSLLHQIDASKSASDSADISAVESAEAVITGALTISTSDSGTFTEVEIAVKGIELSSTDNSNTSFTSVETSEIIAINYDPSWEDDDVPWGGLLLTSKDFAPVFMSGDEFFVAGEGPDKPLEILLERKAQIFDQGRAILGRTLFPQIIGPDGGEVLISLGGQQTPDGAVDWEGPYSFIIGQDISVDFAVTGRYLAVRFESTNTSVWRLPSYDIDYEVVGVY
jgi:hypothetical protein